MTVYRKSMMESLAEVRSLQEDNMDLMRKAAGKGGMQTINMKDGKLKMDKVTASAIMQIFDKLNPANQKKMEQMINGGKKSGIIKLSDFAMSKVTGFKSEETELDEKKILVANPKTQEVIKIDEKDWPKYEKKGYVQAEETELDEFVLETMATIWFANVALPVLIGGGLVAAGGIGLGIIKIISKIQEIRKLLKDKKMKKFIKDNKGKKKLDASDKAELNKIVSPAEKSKIKDEVEDVVKKEQLKQAKLNLLKDQREEVELGEALNPKDKKVVDAFYDGKSMDGKMLSTDGKKLEKTGMGGQTIATKSDGAQRALWPGGPMGTGRSKFKIVAKMDSRSTQDVVKYIEKTFPKNVIEEVELDEKTKWRRGDGRPRGAAHIENERFWDLPKSELEYIIKDAGKAMKALPSNPKNTTGKGNYSDQINDAHTVLGWRRKNSIKEASARSDAMKAMRRSGEFKDKDDDDIRATDADEKAASKNILVQMKSASDLSKGGEIEFLDKKKVKVPQKVAILFVRKYMSLRRQADKAKFQAKAAKSYKGFVSAMKEGVESEHTILDRIHNKIQERKNV